MKDSDLITLVIHTPKRARSLCRILDAHGVGSILVPVTAPGVALPDCEEVRISRKSLPVALKILESGEEYSPGLVDLELSGYSGNLLIPVDLSPYSFLAVKVGFELAARLSLHPVLVHCYAGASYPPTTFDPDFGYADTVDETIAEASADNDIRRKSAKALKSFVAEIRKRQADGVIPCIEFSSSLAQGIPEDVIIQYSRLSKPVLVVMATRERSKKESELIGSVTAEVLDSCRTPVFTIPENYNFPGVAAIRKLVCFCNLDRNDLATIDILMRMFSYPDVDITLVPADDRAGAGNTGRLKTLCSTLTANYPTAKFDTKIFRQRAMREELDSFLRESGAELIIVPNKKTNLFRRLFNPGIAHKILFECDVPLLSIPV